MQQFQRKFAIEAELDRKPAFFFFLNSARTNKLECFYTPELPEDANNAYGIPAVDVPLTRGHHFPLVPNGPMAAMRPPWNSSASTTRSPSLKGIIASAAVRAFRTHPQLSDPLGLSPGSAVCGLTDQ